MVAKMNYTPRYAEFFCGGGMVRAALSSDWDCALANDIDPMKCSVYEGNWGLAGLVCGDVSDLDDTLLHQPIDMYWASSPCQDFSLAGRGLGLSGARGSAFQSWINKIEPAITSGFAPRIIAFENVVGLIARNAGIDFEHVLQCIIDLGYNVGALEIDAKKFLPQSRPRLFVIAVRRDIDVAGLCRREPGAETHSKRIMRYFENASEKVQRNWVWWDTPRSDAPKGALSDIIDDCPDTPWLGQDEIAKLKSMMSYPSLKRLNEAGQSGRVEIGTLYKRGRPDSFGTVRQRAEVRFDGIAGCLRTPAGGSSRQTLIFVSGNSVRARLLSTREASRLMGLPETFRMPTNYNMAYRVAGDGVAVPVVSYLNEKLFQPVLRSAVLETKVA